eukprot:gnl/MRDRNA2_/MRDRNA2_140533_c0_seq1.p1 gnl/MRDRNA2_/MRDRNA2_140533_c0~~gnl/MRDRNA2_/MRDRNA2_140533_c0_seq1.p1  ORF type:complete len:383 (-),score=69.85 gnl/MRDRNA2_/MRDRNA2_140533_c0_seq1:151-1299(-)
MLDLDLDSSFFEVGESACHADHLHDALHDAMHEQLEPGVTPPPISSKKGSHNQVNFHCPFPSSFLESHHVARRHRHPRKSTSKITKMMGANMSEDFKSTSHGKHTVAKKPAARSVSPTSRKARTHPAAAAQPHATGRVRRHSPSYFQHLAGPHAKKTSQLQRQEMVMEFFSNDGKNHKVVEISSHDRGALSQMPRVEEVEKILNGSLLGSDELDKMSPSEPGEIPGADLFRLLDKVSGGDDSLAHPGVPVGDQKFPSDFHFQTPGIGDAPPHKPFGEDVLRGKIHPRLSVSGDEGDEEGPRPSTELTPVVGGVLALSAQLVLWSHVFVTLFKPNRSGVHNASNAAPQGNQQPQHAPQAQRLPPDEELPEPEAQPGDQPSAPG